MSESIPENPVTPEAAELSLDERKEVDRHFKNGKGYLYTAMNNEIMGKLQWAELGKFELVQPVESYQENVLQRGKNSQTPKAFYDYVMSLSDPDKVAAYNNRVHACNADIERIKAQKDNAAAQKWSDELSGLLNETRPDFDDIYTFLENARKQRTGKAFQAAIDEVIHAVEAIQVDPEKIRTTHLQANIESMVWSALLHDDRSPIPMKQGTRVAFLKGGALQEGWIIFKVYENLVELIKTHEEKDGKIPERATVNKRDLRPNFNTFK